MMHAPRSGAGRRQTVQWVLHMGFLGWEGISWLVPLVVLCPVHPLLGQYGNCLQ